MSFAIFGLVILIFSIIIHEVAHGAMAYSLGDPTAKVAGRLNLNPLKHIDLFGSIILPLALFLVQSPFLIGWAKPVPINPYNFKNPKSDSAKVALAGPGANLLIALIFGVATRFIPLAVNIKSDAINAFFSGSQPTVAGPSAFLVQLFFCFGIITIINLLLAIFNLIPIAPLDGSHILKVFLGNRFSGFEMFMDRYGFIVLLAFLFLGGLTLLSTIVGFLFSLITGL